MAGGSAKKVAAQNEQTVKNLRIAYFATSISSLLLRFIIFRHSYSIFQYILVALPFIPSLFLFNYLSSLGRPTRDANGSLISSGADLNQGGITEWAFDVLYITCECLSKLFRKSLEVDLRSGACQLGSALLGEWFNFFYLVVCPHNIMELLSFDCRADSCVWDIQNLGLRKSIPGRIRIRKQRCG